MIYGLIPIGGKGSRLSLPFPKEMLPQKGYSFYNPIANHVVEKMLLAGAEKIIFIHGQEFKKDVVSFFSAPHFIHCCQNSVGSAQVILEFYNNVKLRPDDVCLFGLPDTIFDGNPFIAMLQIPSICAGLFTSDEPLSVDRLHIDKNKFMVRTPKTPENLDLFWGILKFAGSDINKFIEDGVFFVHTEIAEILNLYSFQIVEGKKYIDIGTWGGYNRYLSEPYLYC